VSDSIITIIKNRVTCAMVVRELKLRIGKGENEDGAKVMYHSPFHDDKSPSFCLYNSTDSWHDFSRDEGGDCLKLVSLVENHSDIKETIKWMCSRFGIETERPKAQQREKRSVAEFIADKCLANKPEPAIDYLVKERGLDADVVRKAIAKKQVGFNDYCAPSKQPGDRGYGGPGVAFLARNPSTLHFMAVEVRYFDADMNGGTKTQCQGEKSGAVFCMDWHFLQGQYCHTVYIVESCINALSINSMKIPGVTAVAVIGTGNADNVDWRFLQGKKVVICMDADQPGDDGVCAGAKAAWKLHEQLLALNIPGHMVDHKPWYAKDLNDVNDVLKSEGVMLASGFVRNIDNSLIPGLRTDENKVGKQRLHLPAHDFKKYWSFHVKEDFVSTHKRTKDEEGNEQFEESDLCGFRVAGISRVTIASATATMTGEDDAQPNTVFAVSVQTPRHGNKLIRRVFDDERLHNADMWGKFGPIFARTPFLRMVNILERAADIGARDAVNYVGLAWGQGKPIVNEGPDCYFSEPEKQCPYHDLMFPSGTVPQAREVIAAYQSTFGKNAAFTLLAWMLGSHLKALLGFWPHMVLQADKGMGKSTLIKKMERSCAFTMLSGQSLQTEFRLLTSLSHTSHPIGWEELSARKQDVIDKAVALLQESYQYTVTRRGPDMTQFLVCAPVLLAGEDVPVRSLTGKLVRTSLSVKGDMIAEDLPRFPVLQWLQFLAQLDRMKVHELHKKALDYCQKHCRATGKDEGAKRMVYNYAAVLVSSHLLFDFAGLGALDEQYKSDLIAEMNAHIAETSGDREPWVWVMDAIVNEITAQRFDQPYAIKSITHNGVVEDCLLIKPGHIMSYLGTSNHLRAMWDGLPVKSDRVLRKQMANAEVIFKDRHDLTINRVRHHHLCAISIAKLAEYGLYVAMPEDVEMDISQDCSAQEVA